MWQDKVQKSKNVADIIADDGPHNWGEILSIQIQASNFLGFETPT